jgi:Protein of unknown function (DUF3800)
MLQSKPLQTHSEVHAFFEAPHDNPPKNMLTLTAYVDESQHESDSRHVVVAGFCGSEKEWDGFLREWNASLGKKKALHMKDLYWNSKHSERRVKDWLAKLGPIPYRHHLCPVYGAVRVADYFDLLAGEAELEQKMCGYNLCLAVIFSVLCRDLPGHAQVKIVCEEQNEYGPLARGLFDSFGQMVARNPKNPYFKGIEFIRKDSSPLTQPADYLAFAIGKYLDERDGKKDLWCRPVFGNKPPERIPGRTHTRAKARALVRQMLDGIRKRRAKINP